MTLAPFAERHPDEIIALKAAYGEEGRAYHTWAHVEALLSALTRDRAHLAEPDAVEIAIYYHDAVYDPKSRTNETDSAALMCARLSGHCAPALLARVEALILATASHQVPEGVPADLAADCALFLDMDLSILGAEPAAFSAYDDAIRREYIEIPHEAYWSGRKAILQGFLARERLFLTGLYLDRFDAAARRNLGAAIVRCDQELGGVRPGGTGS